jgi:TetR/AcrR family transcriptional regulator, cholesterol catabolism regulator
VARDTEQASARRGVSRDEVLEISGALFAANGYRATNLQLVAERLGITRQALYYHFRDKGAILGALFDQLMSKLEVAASTVRPREDESLFAAMVGSHVATIVSNTDLASVLLHERTEMAKIEGLNANERRQAYNNTFVIAYRLGVSEGRLRAIDPVTATNAVLAAANSVVWWYHPANAGTRREDPRAVVLDILSAGFIERAPKRKQSSGHSARGKGVRPGG